MLSVEPATIAPYDTLQSARAMPFSDRVQRPVEGGPLFAKWRDLEMRLRIDEDIVAQCRAEPHACTSAAAKRLIAMTDDLRGLEGRALLGHANRAVNLAIRPASDLSRFGVVDRWSAPLETLASGEGDCEDYAILKYALLRLSGLAAEDLRVLIVRGVSALEDHAVLSVRFDDRWLVLDNRRFAMIDTAHLDGIPLYQLGDDGVQALRGQPQEAPQSQEASFGGQDHGAVPALM